MDKRVSPLKSVLNDPHIFRSTEMSWSRLRFWRHPKYGNLEVSRFFFHKYFRFIVENPRSFRSFSISFFRLLYDKYEVRLEYTLEGGAGAVKVPKFRGVTVFVR